MASKQTAPSPLRTASIHASLPPSTRTPRSHLPAHRTQKITSPTRLALHALFTRRPRLRPDPPPTPSSPAQAAPHSSPHTPAPSHAYPHHPPHPLRQSTLPRSSGHPEYDVAYEGAHTPTEFDPSSPEHAAATAMAAENPMPPSPSQPPGVPTTPSGAAIANPHAYSYHPSSCGKTHQQEMDALSTEPAPPTPHSSTHNFATNLQLDLDVDLRADVSRTADPTLVARIRTLEQENTHLRGRVVDLMSRLTVDDTATAAASTSAQGPAPITPSGGGVSIGASHLNVPSSPSQAGSAYPQRQNSLSAATASRQSSRRIPHPSPDAPFFGGNFTGGAAGGDSAGVPVSPNSPPHHRHPPLQPPHLPTSRDEVFDRDDELHRLRRETRQLRASLVEVGKENERLCASMGDLRVKGIERVRELEEEREELEERLTTARETCQQLEGTLCQLRDWSVTNSDRKDEVMETLRRDNEAGRAENERISALVGQLKRQSGRRQVIIRTPMESAKLLPPQSTLRDREGGIDGDGQGVETAAGGAMSIGEDDDERPVIIDDADMSGTDSMSMENEMHLSEAQKLAQVPDREDTVAQREKSQLSDSMTNRSRRQLQGDDVVLRAEATTPGVASSSTGIITAEGAASTSAVIVAVGAAASSSEVRVNSDLSDDRGRWKVPVKRQLSGDCVRSDMPAPARHTTTFSSGTSDEDSAEQISVRDDKVRRRLMDRRRVRGNWLEGGILGVVSGFTDGAGSYVDDRDDREDRAGAGGGGVGSGPELRKSLSDRGIGSDGEGRDTGRMKMDSSRNEGRLRNSFDGVGDAGAVERMNSLRKSRMRKGEEGVLSQEVAMESWGTATKAMTSREMTSSDTRVKRRSERIERSRESVNVASKAMGVVPFEEEEEDLMPMGLSDSNDPNNPLMSKGREPIIMGQFCRHTVETVHKLLMGRADAMEKEVELKRLLERQWEKWMSNVESKQGLVSTVERWVRLCCEDGDRVDIIGSFNSWYERQFTMYKERTAGAAAVIAGSVLSGGGMNRNEYLRPFESASEGASGLLHGSDRSMFNEENLVGGEVEVRAVSDNVAVNEIAEARGMV